MNVLGISAYYHTSAAALVSDGGIVAASEQERFSRVKGDAALPLDAADFCLSYAGISTRDLDYVVFYEKPFRKLLRIIFAHVASAPRSFSAFRSAMQSWFGRKLWIREQLCEHFRIARDRIAFSDHHLSHAAASFLTSDLDRAATLVVDGVGEWSTTTIGRMALRDDTLEYEVLDTVEFPHSLGLLYSALTAYLGFQVHTGEGKVMGLAPYGEPRYVPVIRNLLTHDHGSAFALNLEYFSHDYSRQRGWSDALLRLLGPPRLPGSPIDSSGDAQRYADIARSLQVVLEEELVALVKRAKMLSGERHLCYGGGVALNCAANRRLAGNGFESISVHPSPGDGGAALGAALAFSASHGELARAARCPIYLGQEISGNELPRLAGGRSDIRVRVFHDSRSFCEHVAELLEQDLVVGWLHGRAEWGPRALGGRSIFARPDCPGQKERVNREIKRRDGFRPFAPIVLERAAEQCFSEVGANRQLLRHMLCTVPVKPQWRERLQATTHVDGTARVQLINESQSPLVHMLLEQFEARTGIPALLNTSFNLAGEPIVNTLEDGWKTFVRSGIDALATYPTTVVKNRAVPRG